MPQSGATEVYQWS